MFGEIHIDVDLAGAGGALLDADVDPAGHVASRLDAGAGALARRRSAGGIRAAPHRQAIQAQRLLDLSQGIETGAAPAAAQACERRTGFEKLHRGKLCRRLTKQQPARISSCGSSGVLESSICGASASPVM